MYDPKYILSWLEEKVEGMRMNGTGVLALGRAMDGPMAGHNVVEWLCEDDRAQNE